MSTATTTATATATTASMPTASLITTNEPAIVMEFPAMEQLTPSIRQMDFLALLKTQKMLQDLQKVISVEMEKRWKTAEKEAKKTVKKPKKVGSMPKGVLPPQFRKPNAWKAFVLKHARSHGWPEFTMNHSYKNKETGEKMVEEITLSASVKAAEGYQFPEGRTFNEKDAMSLSKFYWDSKQSVGIKEDLYRLFESTYQEEEPNPVVLTPVVEESKEEEKPKEEKPKEEAKSARTVIRKKASTSS